MTPINLLVDLLPETVMIEGAEFEINSDFRTSILFELLMQDDDVSGRNKALRALQLYFPDPPRNPKAAVDAMLWFYACGKTGKSSGRARTEEKKRKARIYSFDHDDDYIFSAFLTQYGVDLQDIEYLHWWKFRAMFNSLSEDTQFVKIMQYRSMNISSDLPKEQKDFYKRMKRLYALPAPQSESQKLDAITEALMGDGDLSGLL